MTSAVQVAQPLALLPDPGLLPLAKMTQTRMIDSLPRLHNH
jgi:hypothetical protein